MTSSFFVKEEVLTQKKQTSHPPPERYGSRKGGLYFYT